MRDKMRQAMIERVTSSAVFESTPGAIVALEKFSDSELSGLCAVLDRGDKRECEIRLARIPRTVCDLRKIMARDLRRQQCDLIRERALRQLEAVADRIRARRAFKS